MGLARLDMQRTTGIGFWKLLGSGVVLQQVIVDCCYAILATWPDQATAAAQTETSKVYTRYRARAAETWTVFLSPTSVRGEWSGEAPFKVISNVESSPLAALTRATIKPSILHRFWQKVPAISDVIGADPNVMFKIGVGEVPWLHQVTFSIWPDTKSMAEFARRDGPHAQAIRAVRDGDWFAEELYARFAITGDRGTWGGSSPLKKTS